MEEPNNCPKPNTATLHAKLRPLRTKLLRGENLTMAKTTKTTTNKTPKASGGKSKAKVKK